MEERYLKRIEQTRIKRNKAATKIQSIRRGQTTRKHTKKR